MGADRLGGGGMNASSDALAIGVDAAISNCAYYLREEAGLAAAAEQMDAVLVAVENLVAKAREATASGCPCDTCEALRIAIRSCEGQP